MSEIAQKELKCNCGHMLSEHGGIGIKEGEIAYMKPHSGVCNICGCPGFLIGSGDPSELEHVGCGIDAVGVGAAVGYGNVDGSEHLVGSEGC